MDDFRFNILFNSISVISGRWLGDSERLCAMEPRLRLERFLSQAGLEPETARTVGQRLINGASGTPHIFRAFHDFRICYIYETIIQLSLVLKMLTASLWSEHVTEIRSLQSLNWFERNSQPYMKLFRTFAVLKTMFRV